MVEVQIQKKTQRNISIKNANVESKTQHKKSPVESWYKALSTDIKLNTIGAQMTKNIAEERERKHLGGHL